MLYRKSCIAFTTLCSALFAAAPASAAPQLKIRDSNAASQIDSYRSLAPKAVDIKGAMLGSIRTSWEQGTAAGGILELDNPEYSVFGSSPFASTGTIPVEPLRLALSAVVRQGPDGRLSQEINDGLDGAALDGASAAPVVQLGALTDPSRQQYFQTALDAQLSYVLNVAPRTSTGAISMRNDSRAYWNDGVYMGPPFLAYVGAVTQNQDLLQLAYDNCRLYRDALLIDGPYGPSWAHIYSEDDASYWDKGLWGTGNGWAALGMLRVQETISKSVFATEMSSQVADLKAWVKEVLDGFFPGVRASDGLLPNYLNQTDTFGDCAGSAALASVAFREAVIDPETFGSNYTEIAGGLAKAVLSGVDELGVISPLVNPLSWTETGDLSTEGQSFGLMMVSAWRDWLDFNGQDVNGVSVSIVL